MPAYQAADRATVELINRLLEANVLQLILIAPVLVVVFLMITNVLAYMKTRGDNKAQTERNIQSDQADAIVINRLIDIAEKGNENASALTTAIHSLDRNTKESEQERMSIHRANRESIIAGNDGITRLAGALDTLMRSNVEWQGLHSDGLSGIDATLHLIRDDLKSMATDITALKTCDKNDIEQAVKPLLSKLNQIVNLLSPPTPPGSQQPAPGNVRPLNADGAASDATVSADDGGSSLKRTGTEG